MQVRVWELQRGYGNQGITAVAKAQINHDAPVLCTDFSADGTAIFSGGASKQARESKHMGHIRLISFTHIGRIDQIDQLYTYR